MADRNEIAVLTVLLNGQAAEDEIQKLSKKAETLARNIADFRGKGQNTSNLERELKATNKEITALQRGVVDVSKVLNNLSTSKPKELRATLSALNKQLQFSDIKRGSDEWMALQKNIVRVKEELKKVAEEASIAEKKLTVGDKIKEMLSGGLSTFFGNIYTLAFQKIQQVISASIEWLKSATEMAAKAEGVSNAFNKIADVSTLQELREATRGTINDFELMKAAVKGNDFRIPLEDMATLLKFVQVQANRTGDDFQKLAEQIVLGIGRESKQRIDDFGISAKELTEKMESYGNRVAQTDRFRIAVLDIVKQRLADNGEQALTSADAAQQAAVKWENAQLKIGKNLLWLKNLWSEASGSIADGLARLFGGMDSLNDRFNTQVNTVVNLQRNILPLLDRYEQLRSKTELNVSEHEEMSRIISAVTAIVPGAATAFDQYGRAIEINTSRVRQFASVQVAVMKATNKELLEKTQKDLNRTQFLIDNLQPKIDEISERGTYTKPSNLFTLWFGNPDADQTEIARVKGEYEELLAKRQEYNNAIRGLNGDYLQEELNRVQKESEARSKNESAAVSLIELKKAEIEQAQEMAETTEDEIRTKNIRLKQLNDELDALRKLGLEEKKDPDTGPKISSAVPAASSIAAIDNAALATRIALQKTYLEDADSDIYHNVELFQQRIIDLELQTLERKKAIYQEGSAEWNALEDRRLQIVAAVHQKELQEAERSEKESLDATIKSLDELQRVADQRDSDRSKFEQKYQTDSPDQALEQAYAHIAELEAQSIISHEEAMAAKRMVDEEYYAALIQRATEAAQHVSQITSDLTSAIAGFQDVELQAVENKYASQIKAASGNSRLLKKLEEQKEKEQNAIRAKYADKQFIVTVANTIAATAVAAMRSYEAMAGIPFVGPALGAAAAAAAVAAGAAQIAIARQQQQAAKAGYSEGGFTGGGSPSEVAGFVHRGEFVGNAEAVKNPAIRRVFNMIDEAQKNNTVGALTDRDFARTLDYRSAERQAFAFDVGTAIAGTSSTAGSAAMENMSAWLARNAEISDRLARRLDEPFVGEVSITGRRGIEENMRLYDKIKNNATRQHYDRTVYK
jgi:hypothetical protein